MGGGGGGRSDIAVACECVYVDSHLRFQFTLTGLLAKGMVVVCMFCM